MAEGDEMIPACVRAALAPLVRQLHALDQEIARSDRTIAAMVRGDEMARRLMTIPGLAPSSRQRSSSFLRVRRRQRIRHCNTHCGETVTGTLASQGPPLHPNRERLFLTLLDATAPEESLVGSVLFDIRRFPLLRSVPRFFMLQGCVLGDLWVTAARALGRPVSRRNWRHMAAHEFAPECSHRNGLPLERASHPNNV
jgi:hypothetical protein